MNKRVQRRKKKNKFGIFIFTFILLLLVIGIGTVTVNSLLTNKKATTASSSSQSTKLSISSTSKTTVSTSKNSSLTSTWIQSSADNQIPILMFHYASSQASDLAGGSNWMPDSTLEADLAALKEAGYTTLTAQEAVKVLTTKTKPSNKMVWLTFDDGSLTVYRDIYPLLKKYNMHATAAIITGFVDNHQPGILTWEQIKEMKASGLVDFISHTVSHLDLGTLSTADATYQLKQSKKELDEQLNQNTNIICYPAGGYNQQTIEIAKSLGYSYGTLDPGRNGAVAEEASAANGLFTLPRFRMSSTTGPDLMMSYLKPATTFNEQNVKN
ncbi:MULTISPECIES: polysaccharide deacetylase family protein [unclassified Lactococcus]|uniref:polysaccharide deacetylase family protein n=1 Tax=unclassified Lactococcus TaxID=2643510 RepID=UPI0011CA1D1C|nr:MULTISPECIES: polysaccharide deacetylase family protein [unclassified Lactococcus]MQW22678.1 polysaccharide deacetylase family protein [Lactococcus sp. dk101]TXK44686.1 polysaccharide deacetylase family protein [Lactococcus sp. dk310]TXK50580.1 polysaccharide deacetylase family protein [Lactococcus sp. dk322]